MFYGDIHQKYNTTVPMWTNEVSSKLNRQRRFELAVSLIEGIPVETHINYLAIVYCICFAMFLENGLVILCKVNFLVVRMWEFCRDLCEVKTICVFFFFNINFLKPWYLSFDIEMSAYITRYITYVHNIIYVNLTTENYFALVDIKYNMFIFLVTRMIGLVYNICGLLIFFLLRDLLQ